MRKRLIVSSRQLVATGPTLSAILRYCVGLAAAYQGPTVTAILSGDAVRCAVKGSQRTSTDHLLLSAKAHFIEIWADRESLEAIRLSPEHLVEGVQVVSTEEILELWTNSDLQVSF